MKVQLSNGQKYVIIANASANSSSYVALESLNLTLTSGQTTLHNGYHLSANAKQAPLLNTSYLMPFAYRAFKEIDPDGATLWDNLLENTYQDLNASLTVTLHDTAGKAVKNQGALFPNWYRLDSLTGYPTVPLYQPDDYKFGYDAFRTIWFLAYDYSLAKDKRDQEILAKGYLFFKNELAQRGKIGPVYVISGISATEDCNYETPFGFYAVYLNLFQLMGDKDREKALLKKYGEYRRSKKSRVWMVAHDSAVKAGETEYFMNFWTFFGGYLYNKLTGH